MSLAQLAPLQPPGIDSRNSRVFSKYHTIRQTKPDAKGRQKGMAVSWCAYLNCCGIVRIYLALNSRGPNTKPGAPVHQQSRRAGRVPELVVSDCRFGMHVQFYFARWHQHSALCRSSRTRNVPVLASTLPRRFFVHSYRTLVGLAFL